MQNIEIQLINEKEEIIEKSDINFAPILRLYWNLKLSEEKYSFLSAIDPYGNTYYNTKQAKKLIIELQEFLKGANTANVLREIERIIDFLQKVKQGNFAKFLGD